MAGDDCEPSPKRVRTSADDPGNDHLSENAGQNTDSLIIEFLAQ